MSASRRLHSFASTDEPLFGQKEKKSNPQPQKKEDFFVQTLLAYLQPLGHYQTITGSGSVVYSRLIYPVTEFYCVSGKSLSV